jgi:hypothetical protein
VERPAGERGDKWRIRSMSWGSERGVGSFDEGDGSSQYGYLGLSPGAVGSFSSVGRSGSGTSGYFGGTSSPIPGLSANMHSNQYHRHPRTPNRSSASANRQDRLGPMSPRSPSQIIYEYRDNDD